MALSLFLQSHSKYHEWGAVAKSNALFEFVQETFEPSSIEYESGPSSHGQHESNGRYQRKKGPSNRPNDQNSQWEKSQYS